MNIPDEGRKQSGYVICTTGRSGSSYLCQLLESTGILGLPREYFNTAARRLRDDIEYPTDPAAQIDWVLSKGTTPNQIYGLKIFPTQIDGLKKFPWAERLPRLHFVHLARDSLVDQAISGVRAQQTAQWRSTDNPRRAVRYDAVGISRNLRNIAVEDARWRLFFARNGLNPLRLRYEDVLASPQSAVDQIARYLGVSEPATIQWDKVDIAVQRDSQSAAWNARFLAEIADLSSVDVVDVGVLSALRRIKAPVQRFLDRFGFRQYQGQPVKSPMQGASSLRNIDRRRAR